MTRIGRLARSAVAKLPLPISEAQLHRQVVELAEFRGWEWVHFRPGRRADESWYTPVEGPLGKGWPDLVLVRPRDHRLIFAELKRDGAKTTAEQERVLGVLRALAVGSGRVALSHTVAGTADEDRLPTIRVVVWRPADWPEIERVLA
jgi:hypothetical protein